ncbi:hypothetical protein NCC49_003330 [Naganishia albida]|nr:hypothetical protein NCC49_003330 [Naganishia albida]
MSFQSTQRQSGSYVLDSDDDDDDFVIIDPATDTQGDPSSHKLHLALTHGPTVPTVTASSRNSPPAPSPCSLHPTTASANDTTLDIEVYPDFHWKTRAKALACIGNREANDAARIRAAEYLTSFMAASHSVLWEETMAPWSSQLDAQAESIEAALDAFKDSMPGTLEALEGKLAKRTRDEKKKAHDGLLRAYHKGGLFEESD